MRKNSVRLLLLSVFFSANLFAHSARIEIEGENRYKSIRLIPEIYNGANSNLSDILIKDGKGENVPYFVNSSLQKKNTSRETYSLMPVNSFLKDDNFYLDYRLAVMRNSDIIATSMEFSTRNTGFAKTVDIYGSYDDINWEFVQNDSLYVVDGKSKLAIDFIRPQKYTHYRLGLSNNLEQIFFHAATLVYSVEISEETYFIESLIPKFTVEEDNKITKIIIDGLKNIRLCDLTIKTDSMFIRTAAAPGGAKKEMYNLSINDTSYTDTTLPLNRHISPNDVYTVTINNGDDRPINITGLSVRYYADDIVFEAKAEPARVRPGRAPPPDEVYTLEFGADPAKKAPVYDIDRYKNEILKGAIDRLTIGEPLFDTAAETGQTFPARLIFNIVVIVISLLLGVLIVLRLKR